MRDDMQTFLFDLDGTLVDHFMCIYRCYCYAQEKLGIGEPVTYEKVRATVGGSVRITMGRLMGVENAEIGERYFRERFNQIMLEDLHPLPGAAWLLETLKAQGRRTAVFTNKQGEASRKILAHLGFDRHLDAIYGTYDTPWRKPEPEFTQYVLKDLAADPATTVMVGDSPFDIEAGRVGGLRSYVVATGSHSVAQLSAETPSADGVFENLPAFAEAVLDLNPRCCAS